MTNTQRAAKWQEKNPWYHDEFQKKWRKRHRRKNRRCKRMSNLKAKCASVGITTEYYESLPKICSNPGCRATTPGGKGRWCIDHNHKTGKFRGLLCHNCNVTLGFMKDNIDKLKGLIVYLRKTIKK